MLKGSVEKRKADVLRIGLIGLSVLAWPNNTIAAPSIMPGKSLAGVSVGMTRKQTLQTLQHRPSHTYHIGGYIDDEWDLQDAHNSIFTVVYKDNNAVQIELEVSPAVINTTFDVLLKSQTWKPHVKVYAFTDEAGGATCYYFDDVKQGVCLVGGAQDDFILTSEKPTSIIVHAAGKAAVPVSGGEIGKLDTNPRDQIYPTQAASDQATQRDLGTAETTEGNQAISDIDAARLRFVMAYADALGPDAIISKCPPRLVSSEIGIDMLCEDYAKVRREHNDAAALRISASVLDTVKQLRTAMKMTEDSVCTLAMKSDNGGTGVAHDSRRAAAYREEVITKVIRDLKGGSTSESNRDDLMSRLAKLSQNGVDTSALNTLAPALPTTVLTRVIAREEQFYQQEAN